LLDLISNISIGVIGSMYIQPNVLILFKLTQIVIYKF